jgi:hypothetical protein
MDKSYLVLFLSEADLEKRLASDWVDYQVITPRYVMSRYTVLAQRIPPKSVLITRSEFFSTQPVTRVTSWRVAPLPKCEEA